MKTHDTIVMGWDENGVVQFCRTFDNQSTIGHDGCVDAYDFVKSTYPNFCMADVKHLLHTKNFKEDYV
jgi:hypothetical protein